MFGGKRVNWWIREGRVSGAILLNGEETGDSSLKQIWRASQMVSHL